MKIVIFGDSHGNIANIKHVMGFAKEIKAGAVIHTGDWNTLKSIETVLEYKIPLYTVLGNADIDKNLESRLQKLGKANFNERCLVSEIDNLKIGICHLIGNWKLEIGILDVVFTGHYHSQKEWEVNGIKIIRPGALENGINFAVFDTKTKMVEFVNHDKI